MDLVELQKDRDQYLKALQEAVVNVHRLEGIIGYLNMNIERLGRDEEDEWLAKRSEGE